MRVIVIIDTPDPSFIADDGGAVHYSSFDEARSKNYDHPLASAYNFTLLDLDSGQSEEMDTPELATTEELITEESL